MYHGPSFYSPTEIREYLNGKEIHADFDEFVKFNYPKGGRLELRVCKAREIERKYDFDGRIVDHRYTGKILFNSHWENVKNLRFEDKTYSTNVGFGYWDTIQRSMRYCSVNHPDPFNVLVCAEHSCSIPSELLQYEVTSIDCLDFGEFPMLKDYLIEQNSSSQSMSFFLKYPKRPVEWINRYIENKKFPKIRNGEMEYDDGWGSLHLLDLYNNIGRRSVIIYREYIHNMDFDDEENIDVWCPILFSLYNKKEQYNKLYGYQRPYIFKGKDNLHMGLHFSNMIIPGVFLDKLRKRIIPLHEKYQIEEEKRLLAKEKLEKRKKEEEERNKDFNLKNKHSKDANISNDKNHFYLGSQKLTGTTKIISNFFPKFDADYWAGIKAPLMDKSKEQLLEEWERKRIESAEAGTILHQRIDDYYHHKEIKTEDKDFSSFKIFADAYKLNPYRSEWAVYDEDTNIVGVVDMLDYSNDEYILYDWKRSDKIVEGGEPIKKNRFDEYGLKPIENVPNTDYWHYALQLSFYRYILEKNYGIRIKESRLVVLHPTLNLPVVLTTPYMIDEVNKIIEVMKM